VIDPDQIAAGAAVPDVIDRDFRRFRRWSRCRPGLRGLSNVWFKRESELQLHRDTG
jgi:hypothetical protein